MVVGDGRAHHRDPPVLGFQSLRLVVPWGKLRYTVTMHGHGCVPLVCLVLPVLHTDLYLEMRTQGTTWMDLEFFCSSHQTSSPLPVLHIAPGSGAASTSFKVTENSTPGHTCIVVPAGRTAFAIRPSRTGHQRTVREQSTTAPVSLHHLTSLEGHVCAELRFGIDN